MTTAEISYDLVMDDDMEFIEETYRLADSGWQVFVTLRCDISHPIVKPFKWKSGVTGVNVDCPQSMTLNAAVLQLLLGRFLCVDTWTVVRGPDSMMLR